MKICSWSISFAHVTKTSFPIFGWDSIFNRDAHCRHPDISGANSRKYVTDANRNSACDMFSHALKNRKSRLFINTIAASGAQICSILIAFAVTPVLVHALGPDQFGLYAVVGSLVAYFGVLDFGIGAGFVRHLTFHSERGEIEVVKQLMTFGLIFYLVLGITLAPLVVWCAPFFAFAIHLSGASARDAENLFIAMYVYFILSSMGALIRARLTSLHRMDLDSIGALFAHFTYGAVVLLFIHRIPNLYFVIGLSFGQLAVSTSLSYIAVRWISPDSFCNPLCIKLGVMRSLFSFGVWSQICGLSEILNLEADKFLLGHFLGIASVTPYQVGNKVAMLSRVMPLKLLSALLPDMTAFLSRGVAGAEMQAIYTRNTRNLMLATLLVTGFVIAVADIFIRMWIGNSVPLAATVAVALAISYSVENLTGIGGVFLKAMGQPRYEAYSAILTAGVNILLSIILTPNYGLYGVVGGTIIANVLGSVFFIVLFHRTTRLPWWPTVGQWLLPLLVGVATATAAARLVLTSVLSGCGQGQDCEVLLLLGVGGAVYTAVLVVVLALLGFWRSEDFVLMQWTRRYFGLPHAKPHEVVSPSRTGGAGYDLRQRQFSRLKDE